jgi:hypothetical protein
VDETSDNKFKRMITRMIKEIKEDINKCLNKFHKKEMVIHVQEAFRTPCRQNKKRISLNHIVVKTKYTEQGKNIGNYKREAPGHIQMQTHQNNSRIFNRNSKS